MARVVALVADLMFGSRVLAMLEGAGHDVRLCSAEPEARTAAGGADVFVVDLGSGVGDGAALVASMRADGELDGVATLAVYSHVDAATRARAQAAGFDLVVPRSRMVREGAGLVAGLVPPTG
jgi:CheY-like chemotaxis protein